MNCSTIPILPCRAEIPDAETLLTHCASSNGPVCDPITTSVPTSASVVAFLVPRSFSLQKPSTTKTWQMNFGPTYHPSSKDVQLLRTSLASAQNKGPNSYISFSSCRRMKSTECAVTLSILLQASNTGIFFRTTTAFVSKSYRYLQTSDHSRK